MRSIIILCKSEYHNMASSNMTLFTITKRKLVNEDGGQNNVACLVQEGNNGVMIGNGDQVQV